MSGSAIGAGSGSLTDSIFTFVFRANSGDRWGGTLVEDSTAFTLGVALTTAHGVYEIVAAEPQGVDLSAVGLAEGTIFVDWYLDGRTAGFLATRNGPSVAAGFGGLGSEFDAAWNGTGWDSFGQGGADQAEVATIGLSRFTFVFEADSGDTLEGSLMAAGRDHAPGDVIRAARGIYRVLTETEVSDLNSADPAGIVRITAYWDAASRMRLTLENGGAMPGGGEGLGSERDRAWTGIGWTEVGLGGQRQADHRANALYSWEFTATGGDRYGGSLYAAAEAMQVGDRWTTPHGAYRITGETPNAGLGAAPGTVWITYYVDAGSGQMLRSWYHGVLGGPTTTLGLGQEVDAAWDGDNWEQFGRGGALLADVEMFSLYTWRFEANSGDRWGGSLWGDSRRHQPGDVIATAQGRYVIESETPRPANAALTDGSVWVGYYFDSRSGQTLGTWYWGQLAAPTGTAGLGSEVDAAWTGIGWQPFGAGGALQLDVRSFSFYTWRFEATSGDRWGGSLWADSLRHQPGDIIAAAQGRYVIVSETPRNPEASIADGTVWVASYFDAASSRALDTWNWGRLGQPTTTQGLGQEVEAAWTGVEWAVFGLGGARQVQLRDFSQYGWRFEANSGDRWEGSLWEDRTRYQPGDVVTTATGRYVITWENPVAPNPAIAAGTVWIGLYVDGQSVTALPTWYASIGQPSGTGGLGQEVDAAFDGTGWDLFGLGGARQANVELYSMFTWTFLARSGDRWFGSLWADRTAYDAQQTIETPHGRYRIDSEAQRPATPALAPNTVWVGGYFDAATGQSFSTWYWGQLGTFATTQGLGQEYDAAWTGETWVVFGGGGAAQVTGIAGAPDTLIG
jgi:hypothetical protein